VRRGKKGGESCYASYALKLSPLTPATLAIKPCCFVFLAIAMACGEIEEE